MVIIPYKIISVEVVERRLFITVNRDGESQRIEVVSCAGNLEDRIAKELGLIPEREGVSRG